jgi:hypothetical protein
VCPTAAQQIVFQEYVRAVSEQAERLGRLDGELAEAVKGGRRYPLVEAVQALRGLDLTGAITAYSGHRERQDRFIVNAPIGGR